MENIGKKRGELFLRFFLCPKLSEDSAGKAASAVLE
jgi:hypothetical protein